MPLIECGAKLIRSVPTPKLCIDISSMFRRTPFLIPFVISVSSTTNYLFFAQLREEVAHHADEPRKVIIRIYGDAIGNVHSVMRGLVGFTILSERKLGPRLYGVFAGGRIEEYIEVGVFVCRFVLSWKSCSFPMVSHIYFSVGAQRMSSACRLWYEPLFLPFSRGR